MEVILITIFIVVFISIVKLCLKDGDSKQRAYGWGFVIACFVTAAVGHYLPTKNTTAINNSTPTYTMVPIKNLTEAQFINRAHESATYALIYLVKKTMYDPNSFELVQTAFTKVKKKNNNRYFTIHMKYRGKNAFGTMSPHWATAKMGLDLPYFKMIKQD